MAKLKPAFAQNGSSTAGNSSQVSDGAAATLLLRRSTATELGLGENIIGKYIATQTVGCKPDEMGVGPAVAIPKLLEYTGLKTDDVAIWEINEAFASQALYCIRKLGLEGSMDRVNPRGGAIALGHPLGMTGRGRRLRCYRSCRSGRWALLVCVLGRGWGWRGCLLGNKCECVCWWM